MPLGHHQTQLGVGRVGLLEQSNWFVVAILLWEQGPPTKQIKNANADACIGKITRDDI